MKPPPLLLFTLLAFQPLHSNPCWTIEPFFYNPLDSPASIVSGVPGTSWWHPGGQFLGGDFEPGVCLGTYRASADQDGLVRFPIVWEDRTFPVYGGLMEFRFRISGFTGPVISPSGPAFVRIQDGPNSFAVWLGSDPGFQHFGLLGTAGLGNLAAGPASADMEYNDILSQDVWHHCILAWAAGGLPIAGGPEVAVYLDGQLHSTQFVSGLGFAPLDPTAQLILTINEQPFGQTSISNLAIWSFQYWPFLDLNQAPLDLSQTCWPEMVYCAEARDTPMSPVLAQNHPNPFNPDTRIRYDLEETGPVRLEVYNLAGARVATLVNGLQSAGAHELAFDGVGLPSGVYYYRLESAGQVSTRAMTLIR